jgi:hypothetical protein
VRLSDLPLSYVQLVKAGRSDGHAYRCASGHRGLTTVHAKRTLIVTFGPNKASANAVLSLTPKMVADPKVIADVVEEILRSLKPKSACTARRMARAMALVTSLLNPTRLPANLSAYLKLCGPVRIQRRKRGVHCVSAWNKFERQLTPKRKWLTCANAIKLVLAVVFFCVGADSLVRNRKI